MATYYVTKVRKETVTSNGAFHEHIVGVVTSLGKFYTNKEVVNSVDAGHEWYTEVDKEPRAKIKKLKSCSIRSGCLHGPYLTTNPDHTTRNNLENLPRG